MNTQALGGSSYYFALIDDYSRKTWVYFLKEKSQAFGRFKEWLATVEAESGKKLKVLRTDRGGRIHVGRICGILQGAWNQMIVDHDSYSATKWGC